MSSTIVERQRINSGSAVKVPCKAATTANITLSGEQTIDGVSCVTNDRVLVKDQTTASENGIYICNTSTWSRARDWDGAYDVKKGTFVYVTSGTSSGFWYVTTSDPIVPGTTSVTIAQASSQLVTFSAFIQTLLDDANLAAMLASMGFSSDMQSFLQTANDAAALTALGAAADADVVHDTGDETVAGIKTFSSAPVMSAGATLGTAVISSAGLMSAGTVPIDRVIRAFATGTTTADVGTVAVDDYVILFINGTWTLNAGANGTIDVDVWKTGGSTATIEHAGGSTHPTLFETTTTAQTQYRDSGAFIFKVTGAGTLVLGGISVSVAGGTLSSSSYLCSAMVLRNT